jgi:hypothetical protein
MTRTLAYAIAFVILGTASQAKADGTVSVKCGVNEDRVWVYESLVDFNVAAKLKCGEAVQIVGRVKGYAKVETATGTEGYVVDTAFPKSALPPEPEEKPNDVQAASLAVAARRASKGSTKAATASTATTSRGESESNARAEVAGEARPASTVVNVAPTPSTATATSAPANAQRRVAAAPTPAAVAVSPVSTTNTENSVTADPAVNASAAASMPANNVTTPVKTTTAEVMSSPAPAMEASRSNAPVVVASNASASAPPVAAPTNVAPTVSTPAAPASAPSSAAEVAHVQPAAAVVAPVAPKVSASNSISHPTSSRTASAEANAPAVPEIKIAATTPELATPASPPPVPKVEAAMSSPAAPTRAPASTSPSKTAPPVPASAAPATAPIIVVAAAPPPPPAPTPSEPAPVSHSGSNSFAGKTTGATLQPVSHPIPRPDSAVKKPVVNPDEDEETAVKALDDETANCSVYFSAYGLSPNQYKWIAQNRLKAFPTVCPAPSPSMVDFVVIFTHDVAFYNVTMPDAVHFETNGFSDWTPLTTVDTALMNASDADKSHHEYVWVFHTNRGAFDPSKFSARRRPLYSKSETNTLGSRGGFRTVMDALTFIEQNGTNR